MPLQELIDHEKKVHQFYHKRMKEFEPKKILSVTILRCRNVSVNFLRDKLIDTPDPQVDVMVTSFPRPNAFRTQTKRNSPTSEINEKFNFVFPSESSLKQPHVLEVKLFDDDRVYRNSLGTEKIDFSKFEVGTNYASTLTFNGHGEVDLEVMIETRTEPDFRLDLGLHEEEKKFRIRRLPIVYEALKKLIGPDAPRDVSETPVISLCSSGGGYRATAGMAGVMEAIKDHGLLDVFTYAGGLSGSGWYLESAYSRKGMKPEEQYDFHAFLKQSMTQSFYCNAFAAGNRHLFRKYCAQKLSRGQAVTLVDFFGFIAGLLFLGPEFLKISIPCLQEYVEDASVPLPILVSLHVKNDVTASDFHAYMECSPYECSFPTFGIGFEHHKFASQWNSGIIARPLPIAPTHFHLGVTGSAFAIYATTNIDTGEKEEKLLNYIDKIRCAKFKEQDKFETEESEDENVGEKDHQEQNNQVEESLEDDGKKSSWVDRMWKTIKNLYSKNESDKKHDQHHDHLVREDHKIRDKQSTSPDHGIDAHETEKQNVAKTNHDQADSHHDLESDHEDSYDDDDEEEVVIDIDEITGREDRGSLVDRFLKYFVKTRDSVLGRTGKAFNFCLNFKQLEAFYLSPCGQIPQYGPDKQELLDLIGGKCKQKMSISKKSISLVDAGLYNNVPGVILLRPQRTTDFMLVVDFSAQPSDDYFYHLELFATAAHAWREGLKFPHVDFKNMSGLPPTSCHVFDDEDDDMCPIVVWITLSNAEFRKLDDYKPRSDIKYDSKKTKFNDFPVFGPQTPFSTFKMGYNELEYERIKELMYFNISNNIEVIKGAMVKAVGKKRRRMEFMAGQ